ncbi:MAG: hypothetical protein ACR652_10440 [Methylocystis sp.]|uniref:hypothetical protein n=1 Tax=Methylocystis sp. TaxID=1911079 RepID=UPI003DA69D86
MSQSRDISLRIRAAIALVVAWALMFSVAASGAAAASATDIVFKNNGAQSVGLFACFKRHMTQRADAASLDKAPEGQKSARHHCPCCLAAHTAAAVLPARLATPAAPPSAPSHIYCLSFTAHEPEGVGLRAAHGARAPPFPI